MYGQPAVTIARVRRARVGITTAFATAGVMKAALLSRTPAIRDLLGLSSAQLGLLLLCISAGSLVGLPLSGPIVQRLGPGRAVAAGSLVVAAGLAGIGTGLLVGSVAFAAPGMMLLGLGFGVWDVGMNVAGADIERRLGRSVLPRLHAGFSLGTVAGAGIGALSAASSVPLGASVLVLAVAVPAAITLAHTSFLPAHQDGSGERRRPSALSAWREPRTLTIGLLILAFGFTEGSANDWMAVAMVDGYGTTEALGAIGFGVFVTAMTVGRTVGGSALNRFGRVAVLRTTAALGLAGLLLVLLGGSVPVALAGALLWGFGASLGFPVAMSAAADDPTRAAVRVAVIGSIGYTAFLAGPPLIGVLTEHIGILHALFVVVGSLAIGLLTSGASRPLVAAGDTPDPRDPDR